MAWGVILAGVILCYWPGLSGSFVFDDDVNILQNINLRVTAGDWQSFWAAAVSGSAGPLGRPIALLSFSLNYYWADGFNPFQFKVTNLAIHLTNAILIGCFVQFLRNALTHGRDGQVKNQILPLFGLMVAAVWALHPLNLTAVLYVVQRMTSLCTLFGMTGLAIYAWYRNATYANVELKRPLLLGVICAVLVTCCMILSVLTKEPGALFVALLFWTELCIFRFRYGHVTIRLGRWRLRTVFLWLVALVAIYAAIFKLPGMLRPGAYANRDFTLLERGLTEARVLVFYLRMLVLPKNSQLSLFHDDFSLSRSLLSPISTLLAFAFLFLVTVAAWWLRRKSIVFLFGWGWFLISHALESTIFPLELVYEHRNYFATIGLIIIIPVAIWLIDSERYFRVAGTLFIVYLILLGFVTHVRSMQWSNTATWAALEAQNKPESMRANYELGRVYVTLMKSTGNSIFGQLADDAFLKSEQADAAALLPMVARVQLAFMQDLDPSPELILRVKSGFREQRYRNSNTSTLAALMNCQLEKICRMRDADMLEIMDAAYANPMAPSRERAEVLKLMAQYRINAMHDIKGGIELIRKSTKTYGSAANSIMYAQALAIEGHFEAALNELDRAETLDHRREYASRIFREREYVQEAMKKP